MTYVTLKASCLSCSSHRFDFFPHEGSFAHACIECGTPEPPPLDFGSVNCPHCGGLAADPRHVHIGAAEVLNTDVDDVFTLTTAQAVDWRLEEELLSPDHDGTTRLTCSDCHRDFTHRPIPAPSVFLMPGSRSALR